MGKLLDNVFGKLKNLFKARPPEKRAPTWQTLPAFTKPIHRKIRKIKTRNPPLVKLPFYNKAVYRMYMKVRRADQLRGKEANLDHHLDVPQEMARIR